MSIFWIHPYLYKFHNWWYILGSPNQSNRKTVRNTLIISLSLLLFSSPLSGQSQANEDCYLFVSGDIGEDKSVVDQIVRPLIASFVSPIREVPVSGLSQSELNSSCYYDVSINMVEDTLNLSIKRTEDSSSIQRFLKIRPLLSWKCPALNSESSTQWIE